MPCSLFRRLALVPLVLAATGGLAAQLPGQTTVLRADHLVDVTASRRGHCDLTGNPLEDVTLLEHVGFVMKGGVVFKRGE